MHSPFFFFLELTSECVSERVWSSSGASAVDLQGFDSAATQRAKRMTNDSGKKQSDVFGICVLTL